MHVHTHMRAGRQTERQTTDRQTERQTDTHTHTQRHDTRTRTCAHTQHIWKTQHTVGVGALSGYPSVRVKVQDICRVELTAPLCVLGTVCPGALSPCTPVGRGAGPQAALVLEPQAALVLEPLRMLGAGRSTHTRWQQG